MTAAIPTAELLFGEQDATPISTDEATVRPWSQARTCLESAPKAWLSTARPDGRPHGAPVLPVWVDGTPCFATGPASRKGRNLAENQPCVVAAGNERMNSTERGRPSGTP
jgi:hypothetical protein